MEKETTCQICERVIKSKTGVIAHHGYQRPGDGWQTASCYGARHLPFEQSCDAMKPYIDMVSNYVSSQKVLLKEWMGNPPTQFTPAPHYFGHKPKEVVRPDGFDSKSNLERGSWGGGMSYEYEHASKAREHKRQIESGNREIKRVTKRLEDWKPV